MANDVDMWNDFEDYEKMADNKLVKMPNGKSFKASVIAGDLLACYDARFNEGNEVKAEKLKAKFEKKYGDWGNYY